jgi:4'-phosphopantetheinyl transferase
MHALTAEHFVTSHFPVPLDADEIQLWFFPATDKIRKNDQRVLQLLAAYLDCDPADLVVNHGEHGKPHLAPPRVLEFNLTHSADALLLGISRKQALGVDIEGLRRARPVLDLAHRFFDPLETAGLARLQPALRQGAFLQLWSCKEAVVKALGRGIGFGLARVAFALDQNGQPERLNVIDASALNAPEWQIIRLVPDPGYVGALAWRGPPRPIRAFRSPDVQSAADRQDSKPVAGSTQYS